MDVFLQVIKGTKRTRSIHLRVDTVTVGRKRGSNLRIPAASVSRQHCQLTFHDGMLVVQDLKSFNGTFVNGKRVRDREFVRPGDRLKIGPITFVVQYGDVAVEVVEEVVEAVPLSRVFKIGDSVDLSQDFGEALLDAFDDEVDETGPAKPVKKKKGRGKPPPLPPDLD